MRTALLAAAVAAVTLPGLAAAQAPRASVADHAASRWSLALRGGFSSPKGDLGDIADDGQLVALALGHTVSPRVRLLLETSLENLERGGRPRTLGGTVGPDIELWRGMMILSVDLLSSWVSRWEVSLQAGAGGTLVAASDFTEGEGFVAVEPTGMGGLTAAFEASRSVSVFVRGDLYIWYDGVNPGDANYLGKEVVLTHTLGLRFGL